MNPSTALLAKHRTRYRTEENCRCDVSFERPLIASRLVARSYTSRERKLWWKKFKLKSVAIGFGENQDPRSIEGKDKLSDNPLTAIFASLDLFMGFMELRIGTVGLRFDSLTYSLL